MNINIMDSLSTITTIPKGTLNNLSDKLEWCILDAVEQSIQEGDSECAMNLKSGSLIIKFADGLIKYKFIPSEHLQECISDVVLTERNSIAIPRIEESLVNKLTNVYKNFF